MQTRPKLLFPNNSAVSDSCMVEWTVQHALRSKGMAKGRPDFCDILLCSDMQNVWVNWLKWSYPMMPFGSLGLFFFFYMYNHRLKENARLCLRFFRHHLVYFGFPGPKTTALTEQQKKKSPPSPCPILTPGDPKWISQIRWGMHTNRGWQSLLSHWSLAWGCVNTVNFYKVSLCVLCRDFSIVSFFSAWVPQTTDTREHINTTQRFNHSAFKKKATALFSPSVLAHELFAAVVILRWQQADNVGMWFFSNSSFSLSSFLIFFFCFFF